MNKRVSIADKKSKTNRSPHIRRKTESFQSMNSPVDRILFLQRTLGNQAVGKLIKSGALQARFRIGQPNDIYEQEADRVAEQVMRMPDVSEAKDTRIQRKCPGCLRGLLGKDKKDEKLQAKEIRGETPEVTSNGEAKINALTGKGQPLPESERAFFEPRFGHDFSRVQMHSGAMAEASAREVNANAYTVGHNVVFGAGRFAPQTHEGRRLIAHELTHVVQQSGSDGIRANHNAPIGGAAMPVQLEHTVQREGDSQVSSPHDRMVVERARQRLSLLQRYASEWEVRESRRMRTAIERTPLLESRSRMDRQGSDLGEAMDPGGRARIEGRNISQLNRRPLDIQITDQEIRISIRFHVRFEDAHLASRLGDLRTGLQSGIDMVWNQEMRGEVFRGRRLVLEPQVTLVAPTAARDQNYWLIIVRSTDQGQVVYPGCLLPPVPAGAPTSVTDSTCDGGVMSIPPAHITLGDVLGHEMLHLFGLVDRYALVEGINAAGQRWHRNDATRVTGGRSDPLGAEQAIILPEDLGFLFDRLGIYEMEENRGLDTLRSLEQQGLTIGAVRGEMHHLEEIIRIGRDPHSLLPIRSDFNDRMVRDAANL